MGASNDVPSTARKIQVRLLVLAWVTAFVSLPAPAIEPPSILGVFHIPVFIWIAVCFASPIEPEFRYMAVISLGTVVFLLTPWLVFERPSRRRNLVGRISSFALLGPWIFPIVLEFFASPQQKHRWGYQHAGWGYYLFAVAHILAFLAIQIGSWAVPKADRRRGFPVILPPSDASGTERHGRVA